MPNLFIFAWVKNVYSLLILGGITRGHLPTTSVIGGQFTTNPVHNTPTLPRFIPAFPQSLSTPKISYLSLLISRLYPLSTPPINTKTKGK